MILPRVRPGNNHFGQVGQVFATLCIIFKVHDTVIVIRDSVTIIIDKKYTN